jgi:hypothetical protein
MAGFGIIKTASGAIDRPQILVWKEGDDAMIITVRVISA